MESKEKPKEVTETISLFDKFSSDQREQWTSITTEDRDFRYGNQWTQQQVAELKDKGQAPIVINRIHPAIEQTKALLTSQNPSFRVSPREDSDNQLAQALNGLLQYVWQISDGNIKHADIIDDFCVRGIGYWFVYHDPTADMGRGEVKITNIDPNDVYVDPLSRDRFFRDASDIIISRKYSKGLLKRIYPEFKKSISNATGQIKDDAISTNKENKNNIFYPDNSSINRDDEFGEEVRYYERYSKEYVNRYRVYDSITQREDLLTDEEFRTYSTQPAWIVNGQVYTIENYAQTAVQVAMQTYNQALQNVDLMKQAVQSGQVSEEQYAQVVSSLPQPPEIKEITYLDLINNGIIEFVNISVQQIKQIVVAGEELLFQRILKCDEFPIIPLCNIHTGTPYPIGDVRIVKDKQRALNKIRSLILAHASTSTNVKLLLPKGSADVKDIEKKWAVPGAVIEFETDPNMGMPMPVPPLQMSNELFASEQTLKGDIDHEFGIYESMMGNAQQAPATYRATIAVDEFGQRKLKNKMQIIESALTILGRVVLSYCQELYGIRKIIRIIQPNNSITEYSINEKLYDDYGKVINVVNDISRAKYDVIVVAGSTLPSNRYAQLELLMEMYKLGVIDNVEVLKKTEIFDVENISQRMDMIKKLQAQVEQLTQENKTLQGDNQTLQREVMHANQRTMNAEYKTKLDSNAMEGRKINELVKDKQMNAVDNMIKSNALELEKEKLKMKNPNKGNKNK